MSSIDRRVVEMEFDNRQFEAGVRDTLRTLEELKEALKLDGASKGINELESASRGFSLEHMASGIDHIKNRFDALGAIGFSILQRLTNAAIDLGKRITGTVLGPLIEGGRRRALNLEQAHFMFEGLGMDAEATMANALEAVQGTAFGLDEAAKAASQFGASGMRAGDEMTSALRAISGTAAMTNSSYEDMSQVFTKVAGNGRLMGDDLLRLSSRGLNAAATLAKELGITEGEVRQLVTEGQISFEMFYTAMDNAFGEQATRANETYSGSLANLRAAFSRIGASFFTTWLTQQRDLFNALTPAVDAVGEALAPVITALLNFTGRNTERLIDFINAIDFSQFSKVVRPALAIVQNFFGILSSWLAPVRDAFRQIFPPASADQLRQTLLAFQRFLNNFKMGEGTADKVRRSFAGLFAVFGIGWEILKAGISFFLDLFGVVSGGSFGFLDATANIGDFLVAVHTAVKEGEGLKRFFDGLGKILRGPIRFIQELAAAFFNLFSSIDLGTRDASGLIDGVGFLQTIGTRILSSWQRVLDTLSKVYDFFRPMVLAFGSFFGDFGANFVDALSDLDFDRILDLFNTGLLGGLFMTFRRLANNFGSTTGSAVNRLTGPFGQLTITLRTMQATLSAFTLVQIAIAIGVLALSVLALSKVDSEGLARALTAISAMMAQMFIMIATFTRLGGTAGIVRTSAGLIILAIALRILVSSVRALSTLSWDELSRGLSGVMLLISGLVLAVQGISGHTAGMVRAGAGLLIFAVAIRILTSAVLPLANLQWEELARGLSGVTALIGGLVVAARLLTGSEAGLIRAGTGLLVLSVALVILSRAVLSMADLEWEELGRGLAGVAALLGGLVAAAYLLTGVESGLIRAGIGLLILATGIRILASAVTVLAQLDMNELVRGLTGVLILIGGLAIAAQVISGHTAGMMRAGIAILVLATGIRVLATAVQIMGGMSWSEIARGLVMLGGSLAIIAIGMQVMRTALPGAAALVVVAAALTALIPPLLIFASMSINQIGLSLGMLAGVFLVLGVAGMALGPMVPVLLSVAGAVALLGIGLFAIGAGVMMVAMAITAVAAAGAAGVAALISIIEGVIGLVPFFFRVLGEAIMELIQIFIDNAPLLFEAVSLIIQGIIQAIADNLPLIFDLVKDLVWGIIDLLGELVVPAATAIAEALLGILRVIGEYGPDIVAEIVSITIDMLQVFAESVPDFVSAATALMVAFLEEIAANLGDVLSAGADVVIAVIEGIGSESLRVGRAAAETLLAFLNGLSDAIDTYAPQFRAAGRRIAMSIINGITGGMADNVGSVVSTATSMASSALRSVRDVFRSESPSKAMYEIGQDVANGLAIGMLETSAVVEKAGSRMGTNSIESIKKAISEMADFTSMGVDTKPVITPVVDISKVREGAEQINKALEGRQIVFEEAYFKAKEVSASRARLAELARAVSTPEQPPEQREITYIQNNTSPKALSASEIYRQTRNQISRTKGALMPDAT